MALDDVRSADAAPTGEGVLDDLAESAVALLHGRVPRVMRADRDALVALDAWLDGGGVRTMDREAVALWLASWLGAFLGRVLVRELGAVWVTRFPIGHSTVRLGDAEWMVMTRAARALASGASLVALFDAALDAHGTVPDGASRTRLDAFGPVPASRAPALDDQEHCVESEHGWVGWSDEHLVGYTLDGEPRWSLRELRAPRSAEWVFPLGPGHVLVRTPTGSRLWKVPEAIAVTNERGSLLAVDPVGRRYLMRAEKLPEARQLRLFGLGGAPERVLEGPSAIQQVAALEPGGAGLVTSACKSVALLWSISTGEVVARLASPGRAPVRRVAFAPDGAVLGEGYVERWYWPPGGGRAIVVEE